MAESSERALTPDEAAYIAAARAKAFVLYEGVRTTGVVTPALRAAITWYGEAWQHRIVPGEPDIVCDHLVRRHGDFAGPARKAFCTNLAAEVAALTAEALCHFADAPPEITPIAEGDHPT